MTASSFSLPWSRIDTVCLDMDGTLLDLGFDNRFWLQTVPRLYAEVHRLDERTACERVMALYASQQGQLNWYCVDYWSRELNLPLMDHKRAASSAIQLRPGVKAFLEWLGNSDKACYLVTNAHPKVLTLKLETTGIDVHFDAIVSAHDLGLAKEQPGFWERFCERYPMAPESTLFVDDSEPVLRAAEHFGMGYLCQVAQPDLHRPATTHSRYPLVESFFAIMPDSTDDKACHDG
jgi:putative hydrolase of the HAD superfamily